MAEQKKVPVTVAGQSFFLKTSEDDEYLLSLAESIDERIMKMREENPSLTVTKAAVLIAMEFRDDYIKLEKDYNSFRDEIASMKL